MSGRKRNWLIASGLFVVVMVAGLFIAASVLARRFEPYIREQAVQYLSKRFDSEVEIAALHVRLPSASPLRLLLTKGRGALARVEGAGIVMRHRGRRDVPPMFAMKKFSFGVDLGTLLESPKRVPLVTLDGMEIHVPPKGERPKLSDSSGPRDKQQEEPKRPSVLIETVLVNNAKLVILPKDRSKAPLRFDLHRVRLESAGADVAMKYAADLTNAKPPGQIHSTGSFGPWAAEEPGDTPLSGEYIFENADLGVFKPIAGKLRSTGQFKGALASIEARGEASVPDFRLKRAGNPIPLATRFEVLVDGTNGNTVLKPVHATLGSTHFTTSGAVIKHEGEKRRSVVLDASMPAGQMRDLLRLATRGSPLMEGTIRLNARIQVPPLSGPVREKLILDGRFRLLNGKFLRSSIQEQIDTLSRRGQGEPKNREIDEVFSRMAGQFHMEDETIAFRSLSFDVAGASVNLAGAYDLDADSLDFRGTLRLQAKVSETVTGWKRWALKPVDPFFSKNGAGTFLRIKVDGTAKEPRFGRDKGDKPMRAARPAS